MATLKPGAKVPPLDVPTVGGGTWSLAGHAGSTFLLIDFYRGLHCPKCRAHLGTLNKLMPEFEKRGVNAVSVSMDEAERAEKAKAEWGLDNVTIGYGLAEAKAREWGLYISESIAEKEPRRFNEPGQFVVRPDGTLHMATVATSPFARAHFEDLLGGIDAALDRDYPPRGTI